MTLKCAAIGCKSGYDSQAPCQKISFHTFPRTDRFRRIWLSRLSRRQYRITKNSRLCSLHFKESDFVTTRCDGNPTRRKKNSPFLVKRYLKAHAVPCIFPKVPKDGLDSAYANDIERLRKQGKNVKFKLADNKLPLRKIKTVLKRAECIANPYDIGDNAGEINDGLSCYQLTYKKLREYHKTTDLVCIEDIANKLKTFDDLPDCYSYKIIGGSLIFYILQERHGIPIISAAVTIRGTLHIEIRIENQRIDCQNFSYITGSSFESFSQLLQLLFDVKRILENDINGTKSV